MRLDAGVSRLEWTGRQERNKTPPRPAMGFAAAGKKKIDVSFGG